MDRFQEETHLDSDRSLKYGLGKYRPAALQFFNNAKWLLAMLCIANFSQTMATNGFVGSILSTLETRFGLSSTQSALVASAYEIGTLPALVVMTIFGTRINRPLWVGVGMLICSLGSFMFVVPHYASGVYQYSRGSLEPTCQSNSSLCDEAYIEDSLGMFWYVLVFGSILHGIGTTPLYTVGVVYMDEMLTKETSAMYIGIFYSMAVLGPAVGYIGCGILLDVFTDFDSPEAENNLSITNQDPRWVGSWWIGFWLNAFITLLVALPLTGFSVDLPGAARIRAEKQSEAHGESDMITSRPDFGSKWKDVWTVILSLLKNPPFVFLTCLQVSEAIIVQGFTAFGPKYIENQFAITSTMAAILFGAISVPGGAGGIIVGGYVIQKCEMNYRKIMKVNFFLHIVVVVLMFEFALRCPSLSYAGVNTDYNGSALTSANSLLETCNSHCGCSELRFEPVCGQNQMMYYSPCYAGCHSYNVSGETKNFYDCSCIPTLNTSTVPAATSALCETDCFMLPLFLIVFFMTMFFTFLASIFAINATFSQCNIQVLFFFMTMSFTFLASIFAINATFRTINKEQKANGIAFQWIFLRLLGAVPAPLIFGATVDSTCELWDKTCDNSDTSCLLYDSSEMGLYVMLICAVLKALSLASVLLAWRMYKPPSAGNPAKPDTDFFSSKAVDPLSEDVDNRAKSDSRIVWSETVQHAIQDTKIVSPESVDPISETVDHQVAANVTSEDHTTKSMNETVDIQAKPDTDIVSSEVADVTSETGGNQEKPDTEIV